MTSTVLYLLYCLSALSVRNNRYNIPRCCSTVLPLFLPFYVAVIASSFGRPPLLNSIFSVSSSLLILFPICESYVMKKEGFTCVCLCDSERVVLGAGVETLCGEHVLMSTAVQQECFHLFLLHTSTQGAYFMQAQSSAQCTVCTGKDDTLLYLHDSRF